MASPSDQHAPLVEAIVVSFEPDERLVALVEAMTLQECRVTVIDNGSIDHAGVLARCVAIGARLKRFPANLGIGAALQLGMESSTAEWVATFDQDSAVDQDFFASLAAELVRGDERVAAFAPKVVDGVNGRLLQGPAHQVLITSGTAWRRRAVEQVGGFRIDFFMDLVDYELCFRLLEAGWRLKVLGQISMRHRVGAETTHRILGREFTTSNHSPDRVYYLYRNFVALLRSPGRRIRARWTVGGLSSLLWLPVRISLFENQRSAKLGAILAGVADGFRGRLGPRRQGSLKFAQEGLGTGPDLTS